MRTFLVRRPTDAAPGHLGGQPLRDVTLLRGVAETRECGASSSFCRDPPCAAGRHATPRSVEGAEKVAAKTPRRRIRRVAWIALPPVSVALACAWVGLRALVAAQADDADRYPPKRISGTQLPKHMPSHVGGLDPTTMRMTYALYLAPAWGLSGVSLDGVSAPLTVATESGVLLHSDVETGCLRGKLIKVVTSSFRQLHPF